MRQVQMIFLALITAIPVSASAFSVKTTDSGAPVKWHQQKVSFHLNEAGSQDMDFEVVRRATKASFDQWSGYEGCELDLDYAGTKQDASPGYSQTGGNLNLVTFEEKDWAFDSSALAVTLTTFSVRSGQLLDADIVFNGRDYTWGNGGDDTHDFANSLTHEVGHFIGLDHSDERSATMFPSAARGEVAKRDLATDDVEGLYALYGNGQAPLTGTETDLPGAGGQDPTAPIEPESGVRVNDAEVHLSCASAAPAAPGGASPLAVLALLGLAGLMLRRQRRALVALVTMAAVAVPGVASAGEMNALSIDQLVERSERVVVADVVGQISAFEGGIIWTHSTMRVSECISGGVCAEGEEVVLRTPGGTVGDIRQEVSAVVTPQQGQRLVLFLRPSRGANVFAPVGMAQGVLRVDRHGDAPWATRDLGETSLAHLSMTLPMSELRALVRTR